jgi:hypothetical protein
MVPWDRQRNELCGSVWKLAFVVGPNGNEFDYDAIFGGSGLGNT